MTVYVIRLSLLKLYNSSTKITMLIILFILFYDSLTNKLNSFL